MINSKLTDRLISTVIIRLDYSQKLMPGFHLTISGPCSLLVKRRITRCLYTRQQPILNEVDIDADIDAIHNLIR